MQMQFKIGRDIENIQRTVKGLRIGGLKYEDNPNKKQTEIRHERHSDKRIVQVKIYLRNTTGSRISNK